MSDYEVILRYLKDIRDKEADGWILEGNVRSVDTPNGWIGFRGDRNCRDLMEVGILEKDDKEEFVKVRFLYPPEIIENVKKIKPLITKSGEEDKRKYRFQARMYKLVGELTITREEEVRRLVNGIV